MTDSDGAVDAPNDLGAVDATPDVAVTDSAADADLDAGADVTEDVAPDAVADTARTDAIVANDGSILPPVDAGNPFLDAGSLGEPAWVTVDVRTTTTCAPLTPCGGGVVGTWDVSGVCVEIPLAGVLAACPSARVTRATGMARGRVIFDGVFARRQAQSQVEVDMTVPALCAAAVGGCAGLQGILRASVPDSACVATAALDCNCAARQVTTINDADAYTLVGNDIVSSVLNKHWSYCVAGTTLTYQDTSPTGAREPGIISLGRR